MPQTDAPAEATPAERRPVKTMALLAGIVLAGLLLRVNHMAVRSLWFDEAFTTRLIRFPFAEIVTRTARDNNPPLYYLLLKAWTLIFGTSPLALRLPSVLLGGLTIVGMYLAAVEVVLAGGSGAATISRARRFALLVAALVALSALQVRCALDARMYTLGTALFALSSWALLRALRAWPQRRGPWLVYGGVTLLFAYTHSYAPLSIAAQAVYVAGFLLVRNGWRVAAAVRSPVAPGALVGLAIVALGYAPWLPVVWKQHAQVHDVFWTPPFSSQVIGQSCFQMFVEPDYPGTGGCSRGEARLCLLVCGAGFLVLVWGARPQDWYPICAAGVPVGFALAISLLDTTLFLARYLAFAQLFLLVGLALIVRRVPWRRVRNPVLAAVVLAVLCGNLRFFQRVAHTGRLGEHAAAECLAGRRQAGEPVVVASPVFYFGLRYCLHDAADCFLSQQKVVHHNGAAVITPQEVIGGEQLAGVPTRRVWVVNRLGSALFEAQVVAVPPDWRATSEKRFPLWRGTAEEIAVIEYEVPARARPDGCP
jgi:uncharacterized membrane protein